MPLTFRVFKKVFDERFFEYLRVNEIEEEFLPVFSKGKNILLSLVDDYVKAKDAETTALLENKEYLEILSDYADLKVKKNEFEKRIQDLINDKIDNDSAYIQYQNDLISLSDEYQQKTGKKFDDIKLHFNKIQNVIFSFNTRYAKNPEVISRVDKGFGGIDGFLFKQLTHKKLKEEIEAVAKAKKDLIEVRTYLDKKRQIDFQLHFLMSNIEKKINIEHIKESSFFLSKTKDFQQKDQYYKNKLSALRTEKDEKYQKTQDFLASDFVGMEFLKNPDCFNQVLELLNKKERKMVFTAIKRWSMQVERKIDFPLKEEVVHFLAKQKVISVPFKR